MRKFLVASFTFACCIAHIHAQNTFPYPQNGNIGIGTTSPSARLHLHGEMNRELLEKVEEVTLHIIRQQGELDQLKSTLCGTKRRKSKI